MPVAELTEPELALWGERFGRDLVLPAFVTLRGDLGAGKTSLVRAIGRSQGALEALTSPSYALVHEYRSLRGTVLHVDLYRLNGPDELLHIGWEEIIRLRGLVMVEWPERAVGALPKRVIALLLEYVEGRPDVRRLTW